MRKTRRCIANDCYTTFSGPLSAIIFSYSPLTRIRIALVVNYSFRAQKRTRSGHCVQLSSFLSCLYSHYARTSLRSSVHCKSCVTANGFCFAKNGIVLFLRYTEISRCLNVVVVVLVVPDNSPDSCANDR